MCMFVSIFAVVNKNCSFVLDKEYTFANKAYLTIEFLKNRAYLLIV